MILTLICFHKFVTLLKIFYLYGCKVTKKIFILVTPSRLFIDLNLSLFVMPISAIVTTKADTMHLEKVIDSLKDCHQITIVDNGASQKSLDLARNLGCRIFQGEGDLETRINTAIQDSPSTWLLLIDHNETVPSDLLPFLEEFIKKADDVHGLYIPRKTFLLNRWRKSLYPDYQLRFVRKDFSLYVPLNGSESKGELKIEGKASRIPASDTHLAINQLSHSMTGAIDVMNQDTSKIANESTSRNISFLNLLLSPTKSFLKHYFVKGGIFYGRTGFVYAINQTFFTYVKLAKIYENQLKSDEGLLTADK